MVSFRLVAGDPAPLQQSPVTCGSACLTVARMLIEPAFASWVRTGRPRPPTAPYGETEAERLAAYERLVMRRTNAFWGEHHQIGMPWPRALGTPPWGALRELEAHGSRPGTAYELRLVRTMNRQDRATAFDRLGEVVAEQKPALAYVGSRTLPRHVVLILPSAAVGTLEVYDPGSGGVFRLTGEAFADGRLGLSGWNHPWFVIQPRGWQWKQERSMRPVPSRVELPSRA